MVFDPLEFDQLLGSAGRGNKVALGRIYESVAGRLAGYLRAQGYSDPDGGVNDVFLRALPRLAHFKGDEDRFRSWLFTIAHNLIIDERRRRSRRPQPGVLDEKAVSIAGGDVEEEAMEQIGEARVHEMLGVLPESQRTVVLLRVVADLTVEQVAAIMGKSPWAIKALQGRAFTTLREKLAE